MAAVEIKIRQVFEAVAACCETMKEQAPLLHWEERGHRWVCWSADGVGANDFKCCTGCATALEEK